MATIEDLTITECPIQCGSMCERIWTNQDKSHSIRCICSCHSNEAQSPIMLKKEKALEIVESGSLTPSRYVADIFSKK